MQENSFDGVDIDWEFPVTGGAVDGIAADRQNNVEFRRGLRAKLGPASLISIASAAGSDAGRGFNLKEIVNNVDCIGVMTYNFNGAWESRWGEFVGPNAPAHPRSIARIQPVSCFISSDLTDNQNKEKFK